MSGCYLSVKLRSENNHHINKDNWWTPQKVSKLYRKIFWVDFQEIGIGNTAQTQTNEPISLIAQDYRDKSLGEMLNQCKPRQMRFV